MSQNNNEPKITATTDGVEVTVSDSKKLGFWGWTGIATGAAGLVGAGYLGARYLGGRNAAPIAEGAAAALKLVVSR